MLSLPAIGIGVFAWSFAEYAIHNWGGHLARGRNKFSREHLAHHADPRYFAANSAKVVTAIAVLGAGLPPIALVFGLPAMLSFALGFLPTYVAYEVLHWRIHMRPPRGPYGRWARMNHLQHHFTSPRYNHGVTSPLWDRVFGTYRKPTVVRVPERHPVVWMLDPATGEVAAEYADDYVINRPGEGRRAPAR
jgi:sterol desaturase/sphingolipid hydroxylase (fatty acid hydroxylase superfamily)